MTSHPGLNQIDYLECDLPHQQTLREYGRSAARARRTHRGRALGARFRALTSSHTRTAAQS